MRNKTSWFPVILISFSKGIKDVGNEISKLGKKIEPQK